MRVTIILQDPKGKLVRQTHKEFKEITCLSDAAQQLPKMIMYADGGKTYGWHGYLVAPDGTFFVFRERKIVVCA